MLSQVLMSNSSHQRRAGDGSSEYPGAGPSGVFRGVQGGFYQQDPMAGTAHHGGSVTGTVVHQQHHYHHQEAGSSSGSGGRHGGIAQHQWYSPPPQATYSYVGPSNSREMRNRAEKQRRDRINSFIGELHHLVPLVSTSAKKMDKISTLRLSAAYLRLCHLLAKSKGVRMDFPCQVDQFIMEQLVGEDLKGFMMILSPDGKIVFVSPSVESLLGHLQTDLLGESLYSVTASEDRERLKTYLRCEGELEQGWRKYFSIRIKRAGPRSEPAIYETIKMMGIHKQMTPTNVDSTNANCTALVPSTSGGAPEPYNSDLLIFFAKIFRPEPLIGMLQQASKDEYVTRHLIDGRIIGCDQRISLIAGYMSDEVTNQSAFLYMHRDDVRWVMIALRQMYDKGESRGNSCYRLKSRNGEFIYLKTFGFLEIDKKGIVESFVCVNTLVNEDEGQMEIREMKRRYGAIFSNPLSNLGDSEDSSSGMEDEQCSETSQIMRRVATLQKVRSDDFTEDPQVVESAIHELMQNLPSPGSDNANEADQLRAQEEQMRERNIAQRNANNNVKSSAEEVVPKQPDNKASSKIPHLKLRVGSKRAASLSPDHIKRQRMSSVDSEVSQLSPISPSISSKGSPMSQIQKLEEQYSTRPSDVSLHQQHHPA
ncbi:circadian locomoter output cycles protein kaput-like isoform X2 [Sitophilus oryzae]|uniref:Circadian locomoter output cycles protein kaput-like isoform X2 n=1 Tax=Sitophilus oryzae TaxID=7048 RepID=A0A6J2YPC9_SITOR|nr:circadian locomoter output cycles protein kaput-like isoform X2 [Sitophilus oryzae]